jgi:hypothetical protein
MFLTKVFKTKEMTADYCIRQLCSIDGTPCSVLREFILLGKAENLEKIVSREVVDVLRSRFRHTKHLPSELLATQ